MDELTSPNGRIEQPSNVRGVGGWLLVLCVMMTIVGPIISASLMVDEYLQFEPYFSSARGLALFVSDVITAGSVVFGIYAGMRLWSVQSGAVDTAKRALLLGLAAEIFATVLQTATGSAAAEGKLLYQVMQDLIPGLIFFTLCFSYLNRSARVQATYPS